MQTDKYISNNIEAVEMLDKYFLINWHITGWCNYHCPYCINREFGTTYTPKDQVEKIAEKINEYINKNLNNKRVQLRLIGGEPTYYNIPKILDKIDHLDRLTIVTNFSRNNNFFKELYQYCAKRKIYFFLICRQHEEHPNFVEKFKELTKWCRSSSYHRKNFKVPQAIILADQNFSEKTIEEYTSEGIEKLRISILRDNNQNHELLNDHQLELVKNWNKHYEEHNQSIYLDEGIEKNRGFKITFKDGSTEYFVNATHFTNLISDGGLDPTGFYCSSGITNMVIMPNGDIIINKCDYWKDIKWGNILQDNVKLPEKCMLCPIIKSKHKTKCTLCSGVNLFKNRNYEE